VVEGTQKIRDGATVSAIERETDLLLPDNAAKSHEASANSARIAQ
jgi:hypothetical protein